MLDLIFFGILAVILVFKLRSILGKEDAEQPIKGKGKVPIDITFDIIGNRRAKKSAQHKHKDSLPINELIVQKNYSYNPVNLQVSSLILPSAVKGFSCIRAHFLELTELNFVREFGEFFIQLLNVYNTGNIDSISDLVSVEIRKNMTSIVKQRKESGFCENVILVKISSIVITKASLEDNLAKIDASVQSEQIHYVSDKDGNVLHGNDSIAQQLKEDFSLSRYIDKERWILSNISNNT
ncbi:MAG: Tim44/TimA family putative adaptor protein [Alphaproteobacteria bacterium]|nr:Tim44/TimA family putative adaptor protein [Rickettsiales bacterium]